MLWWHWAILAAAIGFAELHVPGSYLIWIALGAAFTAALSAGFTLSFTAQIIVFISAASLSCVAGYFVYRHLDRANRMAGPLNQRNTSLIGMHGVVCTPFIKGQGKVRIGDSVWLAEGPDLVDGDTVIVKTVRGTRVTVEPS